MTKSGTTLKSKHSPFRAVYLDSNVLLLSWPYDVPAATRQILHLAELLDVPVYVPLPVEVELDAHWQRENLRSIVENARALERKLSRLGSGWKLEPEIGRASCRERG